MSAHDPGNHFWTVQVEEVDGRGPPLDERRYQLKPTAID
jgi:hypothetical protein